MYNIPLLERLNPDVENYGKAKSRLNVSLAKDLDQDFGGGVKKYLPGMQRNLRSKIKKMQAGSLNVTNMKVAVGNRLSKQHDVDNEAKKAYEDKKADEAQTAKAKSIADKISQSLLPKKGFKVIKGKADFKPKTPTPGIMTPAFKRKAA